MMQWFDEGITRWAAVFGSLAALLLLLLSCATAPPSRKYVSPVLDSQGRTEESFRALWEKRTVNLGAAPGGAGPMRFLNPLRMTGGPAGGMGEFPLHVTATLMDSLLIEAGLQYHADLVKMTPEERTDFRKAYIQRYGVEDHLLIWCELQTSWAELFLDLDRWIIFIEDDAGNRYEPVRVVEQSQSSREMGMDMLPRFQPERRRPSWEIHHKTVMLCFPKRDFYGAPVLSKEVEFLKLVFQQSDDGRTRAEGIWAFKE